MAAAGKCDVFVVLPPCTENGEVVFAKNTDLPPKEVYEVVYYPAADHDVASELSCTFIKVPQVARTHAIVVTKAAWCWGADSGANEHGVVIGSVALDTKLRDFDDKTEKLLDIDLVRLGLERSTNATEALNVITAHVEKYGQGGAMCETVPGDSYDSGFIIADRREAWLLETADVHWAAKQIQSGHINLANHLTIGDDYTQISPKVQQAAKEAGLWDGQGKFNFAKSLSLIKPVPDTHTILRYENGRKLLEQYCENNEFNLKNMMDILRNKEGRICRQLAQDQCLSVTSQVTSTESSPKSTSRSTTTSPTTSTTTTSHSSEAPTSTASDTTTSVSSTTTEPETSGTGTTATRTSRKSTTQTTSVSQTSSSRPTVTKPLPTTTPPVTTTHPPSTTEEEDSKGWVIVAVVAGAVIFVLVVATVVLLVLIKKGRRRPTKVLRPRSVPKEESITAAPAAPQPKAEGGENLYDNVPPPGGDKSKSKTQQDLPSVVAASFVPTNQLVTLLPQEGSATQPIHFFTGLPDPSTCAFKPFIFCGERTEAAPELIKSPTYENDPAKVIPRFQSKVDRRHKLYRYHEQMLAGKHPALKDPESVIADTRHIEADCVRDILCALHDKAAIADPESLFRDCIEAEFKMYKY